ncbi:hypothetical protein L210DRAFT_3383440 [Boletus edulis BED1]|uniref:F-box domain-containing protein n=1 Tax=Boletus edulis BED1 TaxID=1328754 RepID=A0AAD4C8V2_BOLED|nr:hypothetical protein L210DRAFT_3383440 [Boletus edulis BED1]
MTHFLELPLELLPIIFGFVLRPQHISKLCLVNKTFNRFAIPLLYRRVFIFAWYKEAKTKVILLLRTLSRCPHLARYVEKLGESPLICLPTSIPHPPSVEIRDFPKGLSAERHSELLQLCSEGIRNCVHLRSCTWTRDGSLHSCVLESLSSCPQLRELEINGNDSEYNPDLLAQFSRLSKISLIMPSAHVLDVFPAWISITGETLRSLTLICKASTLVTDAFLVHLSSKLQGLEYLYIIGCPRVTHLGIGAIAAANKNGLVGVSVEGLSQAFDMSAFKATCLHAEAFRRLRAITLTVHIHMPLDKWTRDVGELLAFAPLEAFSMYSTAISIWTPIPDGFWMNIAAKHGHRLRKFSVHRMQISLAALEVICLQCPLLEQLFIVAEQRELDDAARLVAMARNLRTLHINFPLATSESSVVSPPMLMEMAVSIVSVCSPTLAHIGCNTRVWQVKRTVHVDENGEKYVIPTLAPQENPDIPEQFLVIRA